ncbi:MULTISPECIES: hypothetical protein [unclassified Kitasatospora]|uniref:hypothetical protein n=1 Tax=unclassified Kitasatospora TaxID=2633591 RepID=UPI000710D4DF|nr:MULTISPECIES: hypothetical protein [unclassified Kitasatospora]KQV15337.1 hypothetical protein ASC99_06925 [Kitasatospora sp. Root107]KRB64075.1 hypothetical protein ASE03_05930 [Kitasatospora sp. Root187]
MRVAQAIGDLGYVRKCSVGGACGALAAVRFRQVAGPAGRDGLVPEELIEGLTRFWEEALEVRRRMSLGSPVAGPGALLRNGQ